VISQFSSIFAPAFRAPLVFNMLKSSFKGK
jgi:hypothetical protein